MIILYWLLAGLLGACILFVFELIEQKLKHEKYNITVGDIFWMIVYILSGFASLLVISLLCIVRLLFLVNFSKFFNKNVFTLDFSKK